MYTIANSRKKLDYGPPPVKVRAGREVAPTADVLAATADWRAWLAAHFPAYVRAPFADRHVALWEWFAALTPDVKPAARIEIWARGGAKSSTAELGTTYAGCRGTRRFALYVSGTQSQADKHLQAIGALLEQMNIARAVNKYNQSKNWTQQILRAANGFNVVSLGLDAGVRGVKLDQYRPDLIILDDVDDRHDSIAAVSKKIETLTESILPTGAPDYAILFIQNKVHKDSIASQLADARAPFLLNRDPVVVEPAMRNLAYEQREIAGVLRYTITGGEPTWAGQSRDVCEAQINDWGLTAFLHEAQHEVDEPDGGMFSHLAYQRCTWDTVPHLERICVWCDPAVSNTDTSDCNGIHADGIAASSRIYRLWSWEQRATPQETLCRAIIKAVELGAEVVGVETDQGGDAWQSVYHEALRHLAADEADLQPEELTPQMTMFRAQFQAARQARTMAYYPPRFRAAKAGSGYGGKAERNARQLAEYERGRFVHVIGTHVILERALRRFPKAKPFDLVDAAFWSWHYLTGGGMGNSAVGAFG
jgi:hypothetical protein